MLCQVSRQMAWPFNGLLSIAMAQAVFFATLGNKLCKITKIFEELDPIKSQGVLCLELAEDPLAFDGI